MPLPELITHLEALCDAATPGIRFAYDANEGDGPYPRPLWSVRNEASQNESERDDEPHLDLTIHMGCMQDAQFIAALNPQTVKHLLAVCRAAAEVSAVGSSYECISAAEKLSAALTNLEKAIGK